MNTVQIETPMDSFVQADEEAVMAHFLTGQALDREVAQRVHKRAQRIREKTIANTA